MTRRLRRVGLLAIAGIMIVPCIYAAPAAAANTAYVSATGQDTNTCLTEALACLTLDKGISVAGAGGAVLIVGHGVFQAPSNPIASSLAIFAPDGGVSIRQDSLSQPVVTINAGPNDTVKLKNLTVSSGAAGTIGIQVNNAGKVYIENCTLNGFGNAPAQAMFLQPNPGAGNQSQLYVSNSEVSNATGGLVYIKPQSGAVKTYFTHVEVHNTGAFGIKSDGTNGAVDNAITDSAFFSMTGSAVNGLTPAAASPGFPVVRVSLDRTTVLNSGSVAIYANGGGSRVLVTNSVIMASAKGVGTANGGTIVLNDAVISGAGTGVDIGANSPVVSFGNNAIRYNGFSQCNDDVCSGGSPGTLAPAGLR